MATILLLDSHRNQRDNVAHSLLAHGHRIIRLEVCGEPLSFIGSGRSGIDVVLIDIANADEEVWRQLKHMSGIRQFDARPALIMYSSRV